MKNKITSILLIILFVNCTLSFGQSITIDGSDIKTDTISELLNGANFTIANYAGGVYAQMILDRGFEWNPTINDRWFSSSSGVETFTQRDSTKHLGGEYSGKMSISSFNNEEVYIYTDGLNIVSGKQYDFSVWLKSYTPMDSLSFHIGWSPTSNIINQPYIVQSLDSIWTKYSWTFTATSTQQNVRLYTRFYGNGIIFIESFSLIPAAAVNGIREEIKTAINNTGITYARFPNGFEGGTYNWKNAIGDKDIRNNQVSADALTPATSYLAEIPFYNDFGIDEFLSMCEEMDIIPMLLLPISELGDSSDIENAIHLAEYCNGDTSTFWGTQRKNNGHTQPYNVTYWEIGNEQYNQVLPAPGTIPDDGIAPYWTRANTMHYIDRVQKISIAIKSNFPWIKIGAVGTNDEHVQTTYLSVAIDPLWDSLLIANAAQHIDFICPHDYAPGPSTNNPYLAMISAYQTYKEAHEYTKSQIQNSTNPNIELCISEYATNYDFAVDIEINFRLKSTLYLALLKTAYIKQNIFGACYFNFKDDAYFGLIDQKYWENGQLVDSVLKSSNYYMFELFNQHLGKYVITTTDVGTTFNSPALGWMPTQQNIPYLSSLATVNAAKDTLFLIVINSDSLNAHSTTITLDSLNWNNDIFNITTLNSIGIDDINTYNTPDKINLTASTITIDTTLVSFSYNFPKHSITGLKIPLKTITTNIDETIVNNEKTVILYPNPTSGIIHVDTPFQKFKITVLTIDGRIVSSFINQKEIDIRNLKDGIYLIKVEMEGKAKSQFNKVIKIEKISR